MSPPIVIYRIGNFFWRHKLKLLAKTATYVNRLLFATMLPSSATIGKGFSLGYWGLGTVIHYRAIIGNNVLIAQNVTVGGKFGAHTPPKIGNDVYIGAGSVVFGEIHIGDNVIIGANSLINKDIPPNCTVAGNPFRILKNNRKEKWHELKNL